MQLRQSRLLKLPAVVISGAARTQGAKRREICIMPARVRLDAGIRMAAFSLLVFSSALAVEVEPIVKVTQKIIDHAAP